VGYAYDPRVTTDLPIGTVTFLFSDIEGSTELSREHGAAWGDLRAEHRRVLHEAFAEHAGSVIDTEGDAFFVVFERTTDAVSAAIAAQLALAAVTPIRVRIGIHTTEPHLHHDGYVGVGVSRSARICAAAHGEQVVLSHATAGILEDQNLAGIRLRDLGEHRLKDIPEPQRLFQLEAEGLRSEFPPLAAPTVAGEVGTLLATDLNGWGQIMRVYGDDAAIAAATAYYRIVEEQVRANNGRLVERSGDEALSLFGSAEDAVIAAALIRTALEERGWSDPHGSRPKLSAALHTGRLARPSDGHLGSPAFRVVRLSRTATPGQILVSHATQAMLEGQILVGLSLHDLGERVLPGTEEPARVYELLDTLAAD
jgi:class 3 adenylate cyclase